LACLPHQHCDPELCFIAPLVYAYVMPPKGSYLLS
jgi:hypothetical protein